MIARSSTTATTPRGGGHVPALDGLRGLAVLVVMLLHFRLAVDGPVTELPERVLLRLVSVGWVGVDLFFVLSGFLITGILVASRESPSYYRAFYARRALRIFPLYYGFLVARFLVAPLLYRRDWLPLDVPFVEQLWQWLYATNVQLVVRGDFDRLPYGVAHFWSLAVEEQFYLVWPWVVRRATDRRLATLCLAMLAVAPAMRLLDVLLPLPAPTGYVLPIGRMDAFAAGALVALVARRDGGLALLRRHAPWVAALAGGVVAATFVWRHNFNWTDPIVEVAGYTVLTLLFAALVAGALTGRGHVYRAVSSPVPRFFGRYSYAMYVLHLPLLPFLVEYGFSPNGYWSGQLHGWLGTRAVGIAVFMVSATVLTALVAFVSWHAWEKHFLRLKDRFPYDGDGPDGRGAPAPREQLSAGADLVPGAARSAAA